MIKPSDFHRISRTIDFVIFPAVGVMFILIAILVLTLGRMTFNDQPLSLQESPAKFLAATGGFALIGFACCGYSLVRYFLARRRGR